MLDTVYQALSHGLGMLSGASEGARLIERDGVTALLVPATPDRSVVNSVTYESPEVLRDAYDEIAAAYDEIGATWTVWVRHGDRATAELLAERGHVLDAEPEAMARTLDDPPARPELDLEWTSEGDMRDIARLNDLAYEYELDSFAPALAGLSLERGAVYVAHDDGKPVGGLVMADSGANSDLEWVAVVPAARGRGLSGKLLAHALADAAERGQQTTTLVSSPLGRPVYERLGYRPLGALTMWERRR